MRKITAGLFISLDGVVEAPEKWTRAYASPEIDQEIGAQMGQADTMAARSRDVRDVRGLVRRPERWNR